LKFLDLQSQLKARQQAGLYRQRLTLQSAQQVRVKLDGRTLLNFSSNDYLGLATSGGGVGAMQENAGQYGFGSGASHLICGHQRPHQLLEGALADFVERDAAVTFSSGYMANLAILQTLAKKGDLIVADKLNHASLIDGARLSQADCKRYPHLNMGALQQRLAQAPQNKFVVSDSVFSMDGDLAPLKEMARLCDKYNAILIVDDAHGFGVLGENGRGCGEHFGLSQSQLPVYMGTLGKALGGYGAFVAGERSLVDYLVQHARSYIYTTAMPAAVAAANLANLEQLASASEIRIRLFDNIDYFTQRCQRSGIQLMTSHTPIQPLLIPDSEKLLEVQQTLFDQGLLVGAIRPPTVAENASRLRITLTAGHRREHIDQLVSAIKVALNSATVAGN